MITAERLKWLQDNKKHGEVAATVKKMNPNNSSKGITYTEGLSIINGNLWGKHGQAFTDQLEKVIRDRIKHEERERERYSQLNT